ncbi:hypothetical protein ACFOOL_06600 [Devosia honganensis]|uniref:DUF2336 domain-containing protein n=1 Tax=Devosia honganensis TaxID=1610527 RepID=A0ABV7WYP6_9HYPH
MSNSLLSRAHHFDEPELAHLIEEFSDRLRRDAVLRPALDRLVGNHWAAAEGAAIALLSASLLNVRLPQIDIEAVHRASKYLSLDQLGRLKDMFIESAMVCLPLESAAQVAEIAFELEGQLAAIVSASGVQRQKLTLALRQSLASGALLNGL